MTVIELTLTLSLMVSLSTVILFSIDGISRWRLGRVAGEELRSVYLAQKTFLADYPTTSLSDISSDDLVNYLTGGRSRLPVIVSLDDSELSIDFNRIPPVLIDGGIVYDPSGNTADSLWDAGVKN